MRSLSFWYVILNIVLFRYIEFVSQVKNGANTSLDVRDMKDTLEKLRKDLNSQAEGAESNQVQAEKLFAFDKMSTEQKKAELQKSKLVRHLPYISTLTKG